MHIVVSKGIQCLLCWHARVAQDPMAQDLTEKTLLQCVVRGFPGDVMVMMYILWWLDRAYKLMMTCIFS
jgi:hypothetical protein